MTSNVRVKQGGLWKTPNKMYKKINGEWVEIKKAYTKINGIWNLLFSKSNFEFKDNLLWTENFFKFLLSENYNPIVTEPETNDNVVDKTVDRIISFDGPIIFSEDILYYLENEETDDPLITEENTSTENMIDVSLTPEEEIPDNGITIQSNEKTLWNENFDYLTVEDYTIEYMNTQQN